MASSSSSSTSSFCLLLLAALVLMHGVSAARHHHLKPKPKLGEAYVRNACTEHSPAFMYETCVKALKDATKKNYSGAFATFLTSGAKMAADIADKVGKLENKETSNSPLKKALGECKKQYARAATALTRTADEVLDKKAIAQASLMENFAMGYMCQNEFRKANLKSPLTLENTQYTELTELARDFYSGVKDLRKRRQA